MNNKNAAQGLGDKIEKVVQEHIAQLREDVAAAVHRALSGGASPARARAVTKPERTRARRRGQAELVGLAESFFTVVCEAPGESMATLSAKVGKSAQQLHRPVANLRRAGRVRSVGERQHARYFPMAGDHARS